MAKYLVTGGAGFIGSHIATALVDQGQEVRVIDNLCTGFRLNLDHIAREIDFIEADLLDRQAVERAVAGVDVVFHQAALASVPRSLSRPMDTNAACVTATLNLLDASCKAGVKRLIYAGSSSAYGNQPHSSKREIDLPAPLSPYAAAKLAGEMYCQSYYRSFGLETVIVRYFNVFGPRQDPHSEYSAVIPRFVTQMVAGDRPTIFGDGGQSRDFTFVENVVRGNLAAATVAEAAGRTLNLACGTRYTLLQLVHTLNEVLGTSIEPIFAPPRTGDVRESLADISLARSILGYEPRIGFREGLLRSIEYYKEVARR